MSSDLHECEERVQARIKAMRGLRPPPKPAPEPPRLVGGEPDPIGNAGWWLMVAWLVAVAIGVVVVLCVFGDRPMPLNSPNGSSESTAPATKSKTYTSFGADLNLVALGGGPCRAIRANMAGVLNVDYGNGITDLLPFLAGETQVVQASKLLVSGSVVTAFTIFW